MKTIEQASSEHAVKRHYDLNLRKFVVGDFKAGVEFAQQWISVKDEFPEDQEIILVKTDKGCYSTAYLHGKKSGFIIYGADAYEEFGNVTHWRPIELNNE